MKINYKLTLGFLVVTFLIWVVGFFAVKVSQKALQKSIEEDTLSLAVGILDKIDRNIYSRIEDFMGYSKDLILQETVLESNQRFGELGDVQAYINKRDQEWTSVPKNEVTAFMQQLINNKLSRELREKLKFYEDKYGYKVFGEVFFTNKYGANVAQSGKTTDYRQDDEEWWQEAKKNGLFVRDVEYDESAGVYSTDIGIGIDDENGNFIGLIKVVLNIAEVIHILKEIEPSATHKEHKTMKYYLITEAGSLICSTGDFEHLKDVSNLFPELKYLEGEHTGKYIKKDDKHGEILSVYVRSRGYKDFRGLGWTLLIEHKSEEIFAPVNKLMENILIASLIVTIFAITTGFFISRSITKPITQLRDASIEIGRGNLDVHVDAKSNDEIGQLAASFNKMTGDLQSSKNKIISAKKYTDNIIHSMVDTLVVLTSEGRIKTVNQATLDILGYTEEELLDQPARMVFAEEEVYSFNGTGIADLIKKGCIKDVEKTYLAKDGRKIPVLFSGSVMRAPLDSKHLTRRDDTGKIQGIVCVALDISERKQAEEKLKNAYEELKSIQQASVHIMEDLENELRKRQQVEEELKKAVERKDKRN